MSRSVVCGVDWSEESIAAVSVASELSRRLGATLVLAHVAGWAFLVTVIGIAGAFVTGRRH